MLKHTLVYRVEQVLLVQRSTGLLVQHVERPDIESKDGDAVSAMLTAIQDFVRDSFAPEGEQGGDLGSVSVGDQTVWLVNSPDLTMACVIRGIAPVSLRTQLQEVLEDMLLQYAALIQQFDGDREPMAPLVSELERCFGYVKTVGSKTKSKPNFTASAELDAEDGEFSEAVNEPELAETSKPSRLGKILKTPFFYIALAIFMVVVWVLLVHKLERDKKSNLLALYAETPGIVVTNTHWQNVEAWGFWKYLRPERTLVIDGLQDPSFNDADRLAKQVKGYADERIDIRMQPYLSLHADAQLQRAQVYFAPPASVRLSLQGAVVTAEGEAKRDWLQQWSNAVVTLPGVQGIDVSHVKEDLSNEKEALKQSKEQLEQLVLYFKNSQSTAQDFESTMAELVQQLKQYQIQAANINQDFQVELTAYSDQLGGETLNQPVRMQRAKQVKQLLIDGGLAANNIITKDGGALGEEGVLDKAARKVTIAIKGVVNDL